MATAPELADPLEEVRPLARALAVELIRQELTGLGAGLNGAGAAEQIAPSDHHSRQRAANGATGSPGSSAATRRGG